MPQLTRVNDLLNEVYQGGERLARPELQRRAAGLDLAQPLRELVGMLPDGDYDRDQAGTELSQIQQEEGLWRDEERLPQADLNRAMATSGTEGQFDDPTGHEAGPGETFERDLSPERPSPEGRSGPH